MKFKGIIRLSYVGKHNPIRGKGIESILEKKHFQKQEKTNTNTNTHTHRQKQQSIYQRKHLCLPLLIPLHMSQPFNNSQVLDNDPSQQARITRRQSKEKCLVVLPPLSFPKRSIPPPEPLPDRF